MKYRTVIELVTEAEDTNEAMDIAGEYLRGNFENDVKMKCRTKPLKLHVVFQASAAVAILVSVIIGIASFGYFESPPVQFSGTENVSAIQPPLKTAENHQEFNETWQEKADKKVLEYIKKQ